MDHRTAREVAKLGRVVAHPAALFPERDRAGKAAESCAFLGCHRVQYRAHAWGTGKLWQFMAHDAVRVPERS